MIEIIEDWKIEQSHDDVQTPKIILYPAQLIELKEKLRKILKEYELQQQEYLRDAKKKYGGESPYSNDIKMIKELFEWKQYDENELYFSKPSYNVKPCLLSYIKTAYYLLLLDEDDSLNKLLNRPNSLPSDVEAKRRKIDFLINELDKPPLKYRLPDSTFDKLVKSVVEAKYSLDKSSEIKSNTNTFEEGKLSNMADSKIDNAIFIIHGHDMLNTLELQRIIRDDFSLNAIVLKYEPDGGRFLLEKFVEEASKCNYAFALFTKDDFISTKTANYYQARPNVIFELGWFIGKNGKGSVTILCQTGTEIPSDLHGILRKEFREDVSEKSGEIRKELVKFGLLKS